MQAPQAPDPFQTAQAQTASNKDTAIAQSKINAVNQVTPQGNLTYSESTWADGTPRLTATTTYSPEQQALMGKTNQIQSNLADTGVAQSQRLGQLLSQPFSLSNEATEGRLMELGRKRLDPALASRRASTEQDLFNRGVRPGTEAYDKAMRGVTEGENDAYNQLLLTGRGQAVNEALTERNQPLNEIMGLASGTQIQAPQFQSTPQSGVAPTDISGLVQQNYQSQMQQYNAGMSGLFGLGATALGGWMMSDRRLKEDVHKVGETADGIPVKTFRYKGSPMMHLGMMAQDVEKKRPEAVATTSSGYKAVNYPMAMGA